MNPLITGGLVGGIAAFLTTTSEASQSPMENDPQNPAPFHDNPLNTGDVPAPDMMQYPESNIEAFLKVIREGESNNDYYALVGTRNRMSTLHHHPAWTDASMTTYSGMVPWRNSRAAGAYQFQPVTFREATRALGLNGSMSVENQDAAAKYLIRRRGAYQYIAMGDVASGVALLRKEWQMFETPRWSDSTVIAHYQDYGGTVA